MPTTITVCETCRHEDGNKINDKGETGGALLAACLETAMARGSFPGLTLRRHACLMGCERHCNIAITAPGKMTYFLSRFAPDPAAAEAILGFAAGHADSPTGQVPFRSWPQGVKGHFAGRVPPVT